MSASLRFEKNKDRESTKIYLQAYAETYFSSLNADVYLSDFRCDLFELCLLVFAFDMCGVVLRDGW
jgi:hypothetical protein